MSCQSGAYEDFSAFVAQTYDLIGAPTGNYSLAQVSGYFLSNGTLGKLNNLIDGNFFLTGLYSGDNVTLTGFLVQPDLCNPELAILQNLFMVDYYNIFANQVLRSAGTAAGSVMSVKEADNNITFLNKNQLVANIRGFAKDSKEILDKSVKDYLRFASGGGLSILSNDVIGFPIVNTVGFYGAAYNWGNWRVNYIPYFGTIY